MNFKHPMFLELNILVKPKDFFLSRGLSIPRLFNLQVVKKAYPKFIYTLFSIDVFGMSHYFYIQIYLFCN